MQAKFALETAKQVFKFICAFKFLRVKQWHQRAEMICLSRKAFPS
jgi:hypothetical protein